MINKRWALVILAVVTFMAYINVYQNDFISDDIEGILKNKEIGNLTLAVKQLAPVSVVNSSIFLLFGQGVPYYHFSNVAIHIVNVMLVYFLLKLLAGKRLAFFAAFLFALHPVHTEAVTWISGKPYVLYSFFLLTSLILYIKSMKGNKLFLIFSLLGYALALLTTEKAIMFPGLIILYIVCFKTGLLCSLRSLAMTFFPFFIITFLYGLTLISRIPERIAAVNPSYGPTALTYNPILQVSTAVSSYLELFIVPLRLTFYHDTAGIGNLILAFMIILTAAFIITTVYLFRKNKLLFFGASFFVISISPTLIPISVGWVVAERYFYLGSLGLCIMLAYLILKFKKHSLELLTLILAVYFILTLYRNTQWKNEDALWPVTLERSPGVPVAHNNMGDYYARRGDYINAIKEFSMAVSLRDGLYPEAMHNLGNSYRQVGDLKKAEELYLRAIELKPDQIESYLELSSMYKSQNDLKKAEEYYQKAFQLAQ